jgi:hypothetical protein
MASARAHSQRRANRIAHIANACCLAPSYAGVDVVAEREAQEVVVPGEEQNSSLRRSSRSIGRRYALRESASAVVQGSDGSDGGGRDRERRRAETGFHTPYFHP